MQFEPDSSSGEENKDVNGVSRLQVDALERSREPAQCIYFITIKIFFLLQQHFIRLLLIHYDFDIEKARNAIFSSFFFKHVLKREMSQEHVENIIFIRVVL